VNPPPVSHQRAERTGKQNLWPILKYPDFGEDLGYATLRGKTREGRVVPLKRSAGQSEAPREALGSSGKYPVYAQDFGERLT
jgi:hypothetical protein